MYNNLLFLQNAGITEFLVIGVVILIFFGGKKIPEFMRGLGRGIREFNDAKNEVRNEMEAGLNTDVETPPAKQQNRIEKTSTITDASQKKSASKKKVKVAE